LGLLLSVLLFPLFPVTAQFGIENGLVSWWDMDTSQVYTDSHGDNDLSIVAPDVEYVATGKLASAAEFSGGALRTSSQDYTFMDGGSFTFSMWVQGTMEDDVAVLIVGGGQYFVYLDYQSGKIRITDDTNNYYAESNFLQSEWEFYRCAGTMRIVYHFFISVNGGERVTSVTSF
jgi:hypothetical protein